jgi:diguanylate cyclase (GGDEF)-like protein
VSRFKPARVANLKIFDQLYLLTLKLQPADEDIDKAVLISIDDVSLRNVSKRWPWPRPFIAKIVKKLAEYDPAVIGIDLGFFGESEDKAHDLEVAEMLQGTTSIVLPSYFGLDRKYTVPNSLISNSTKSYGFVNKPRDPDDMTRRIRPFMRSKLGNIIDYSFGIKTAGEFLGKSPEEIAAGIPLQQNDTIYLRFFGKKNDFKQIPVWKVVNGDADLTRIKDRMVFLGVTTEVLHDTYLTPIGRISGVLICLNEALTYATGRFFSYTGYGANLAILFFFVFIAVIGGFRLSFIQVFFLTVIDMVGFIVFCFLLLMNNIITDYFGGILLIFTASILLSGARSVELVIENIVLKKEALTDGLTGLYVYRFFEKKLKTEFRRAKRENRNLAMVLYDVDHFKEINDKHGHEFGNKVLKAIARIMEMNSRSCDTVARYGGEEFCIIMPDTKGQDAKTVTERVRRKIKELKLADAAGESVEITISAGIATIENYETEKHMDFVCAADAALYRAKDTGRDRSVLFDKDTDKIV